ncbi:MAG: peptide-methionine (S)-S-oxide reductase MsrA [Pseudomonadota bacterium]
MADPFDNPNIPPKNYSEIDWSDNLSPEQYDVMFNEGTEHPFSSHLNHEHRDGVYVCGACGLELFKSDSKFDSKTGWPSFYQPIAGNIAKKTDYKLLTPRTEFHCARCGGHLGHVFNDADPAHGGQRWCTNGVALRFIPASDSVDNDANSNNNADEKVIESEEIKSIGKAEYETAILAAGCFWCIEAYLEKIDGIIEVVSGYTGGSEPNPSYESVSTGRTGHTEAVKVIFDPTIINYSRVLELYWKNVDPLNNDGQFCDIGSQYMPAIFYLNESQQQIAVASVSKAEQKLKIDKEIITPILPASEFYDAEDYHQDYYKKNPVRYQHYRNNCGRNERLEQLWGREDG